MKKFISLFILSLTVAAGRAALPQPDLIAEIHFAGAQKISAAPNAVAFTNEFCSAEALALRQQIADKLAPWLAGCLQAKTGVKVSDGAAKLRPLFVDLQKSEWFLEARAAVDNKPDVAVAIKLDATRAQLWQTNLKLFFPAATFQSTGGWLIFDSGTAPLKLGEALAKKISSPSADWGSVDVNWPRLAQWYPKLKQLGLPETQFTVTAPDDNFRIAGKFFFPENVALNLEPWRMPTNTIRQPFISFTAVRGFAQWFQAQDWLQPYQISPLPNQAFIWALQQVPYQTYAAVPVGNATDALAQLYARLQPVIEQKNSQPGALMPLNLALTNNEIAISGVPFAAPSLRAIKEPAGQFLFASAFPNTPRPKPLPPELFQRLAQKDLLLYHWEITAERWPLLLNVSQLGMLISSHQQLDGGSASMNWCQKIAPHLGNTITEIFQTGPAEMSFNRKGMGLFTSAEMYLLSQWLENRTFPHFDLQLPARKRPLHPHSAAPAPAK
jgi:hypothetical protein